MNVVPVPKTFLFVGAVALSGIVAGMMSAGREPKPALAQFAKLIPPPFFDERWDDATAEAALPKQDRLAVKTESPQPVKVEKIALVDAKPETTETIRPQREHNICTRNGMRKETTHGGRSWRCRR